jgi:hypothetical protein
MSEGATLLVVERDLGAPNEDAPAKFSDLNMLVGPGGRERTQDQYASLFESTGFRLVGATLTAGTHTVFEGKAI